MKQPPFELILTQVLGAIYLPFKLSKGWETGMAYYIFDHIFGMLTWGKVAMLLLTSFKIQNLTKFNK